MKQSLLLESGVRIPPDTKSFKILYHDDMDGVGSAKALFEQIFAQYSKQIRKDFPNITKDADVRKKMNEITQFLAVTDGMSTPRITKALTKDNPNQMIAVVDFDRFKQFFSSNEAEWTRLSKNIDFHSDHHESDVDYSKETKISAPRAIGIEANIKNLPQDASINPKDILEKKFADLWNDFYSQNKQNIPAAQIKIQQNNLRQFQEVMIDYFKQLQSKRPKVLAVLKRVLPNKQIKISNLYKDGMFEFINRLVNYNFSARTGTTEDFHKFVESNKELYIPILVEAGILKAVKDYANNIELMDSIKRHGEFYHIFNDKMYRYHFMETAPEREKKPEDKAAPIRSKKGGSVGATSYGSDTAHITEKYAPNKIDIKTIMSFNSIDSAKYEENLKNVVDFELDPKNKERMLQLAIRTNHYLNELTRKNRNEEAVDWLIKNSPTGLVGIYTKAKEAAEINNQQTEAFELIKSGLKTGEATNLYDDLVEKMDKIHKLGKQFTQRILNEVYISSGEILKKRIPELKELEGKTKEEKLKDFKNIYLKMKGLGKKLSEKYSLDNSQVALLEKSYDGLSKVVSGQEARRYLRNYIAIPSTNFEIDKEETDFKRDKLGKIPDIAEQIKENLENIRNYEKVYKEFSTVERGYVVASSLDHGELKKYNIKSPNRYSNFFLKNDAGEPFIAGARIFDSIGFIQFSLNPTTPKEIKDKIDLIEIAKDVLNENKERMGNSWAFDIVYEGTGGHKSIVNIPSVNLFGLAGYKTDRDRYYKSKDILDLFNSSFDSEEDIIKELDAETKRRPSMEAALENTKNFVKDFQKVLDQAKEKKKRVITLIVEAMNKKIADKIEEIKGIKKDESIEIKNSAFINKIMRIPIKEGIKTTNFFKKKKWN